MMSELLLKTIHGETFPRYALATSEENTKECYLVSAAEELLKNYKRFWAEELPQMLAEAKEQAIAEAEAEVEDEMKKTYKEPIFSVERITLEEPTSPLPELSPEDYCRQYKETLNARVCIEVGISEKACEEIKDENKNFIFWEKNLLKLWEKIPYLSPEGTFIFLGNDYVYTNTLTKKHEVSKEDPRPVNSLETKYVYTLNILLRERFKDFLKEFYADGKQKAWEKGLQKGKATEEFFRKLLTPFNFSGNIKLRSELLKLRNPLEEISTHNTIKSSAAEESGFAYRDISHTQYGRICPVETPEGKKTGLVQHLAAYAKIDDQGQILTPYYEVDTKNKDIPQEPKYLSVAEEQELYLAAYDKNDNCFPYLRHEQNFVENNDEHKPSYKDLCKGQILSHSTALIPFLEHDDGHRALMAASMQKQAVKLCHPEPPIIGTGREHFVADKALLCRDSIVDEELALGTNLIIAYMPWEGYTHEDAIVISDELVDNDILTSEHTYTYDITIEDKEVVQKVIKEGTALKQGDILVKKQKAFDAGDSPISIFKAEVYRDVSLRFTDFPYVIRAKVEKVILKNEHNRATEKLEEVKSIRITISYQSKIKVGDKLAGRHGNKGVVSLILPKNKMPFFYADEAKTEPVYVQIIMDPLSIPSRMNLGQLYETHLGRLALRLGQLDKAYRLESSSPFKKYVEDKMVSLLWEGSHLGPAIPFAVPPFSSPSLEEIQKLYVAAGLDSSCKETVYYSHYDKNRSDLKDNTVHYSNKITVGVSYILKLDHMAENDINTRSTGKYTKIFQQPAKGRKLNGGQRMGEMEIFALEAYGAKDNLEEFLTYKADDVLGRAQLQKFLLKGNTDFKIDAHLPHAFLTLQDYLNAIALKIELILKDGSTTQGDESITSADIQEARLKLLSVDEIKEISRKWDEASNKEKSNKEKSRKESDKTSLIKLAVPVVHPLFVRHLATKLGLSEKDLRAVIYYRKYLCEKQLEAGRFEVISLEAYLNHTYDTDLNLLGTGAVAVKEALEKISASEDIQLKDIILTFLPKLPKVYFPENQLNQYQSTMDPLAEVYARLEQQNEQVKSSIDNGVNEAFQNLEKCKLQAYVDGLISNGDYDLVSNIKNYNNLLNKISQKKGVFRNNLLGKRVDYSARAVIISDPSLKLDQCGVSMDMALELFKPLLKRYDTFEAKKEALKELIQDRVVILGRNPALHRLSLQAFHIKLVDDLCIHLNPLVCAGFNADFDGDHMFLLLPLSDSAQKEAREKMLATNNLLSPGTGKPIVTLTQEMILGIYRDTFIAPPYDTEYQPFNSIDEAKKYLKDDNDETYRYRNSCITVRINSWDTDGNNELADVYDTNGSAKTLDATSIGLVNFNRYVLDDKRLKSLRKYQVSKDQHGEIIFDGYDKQALEELISGAYLPNERKVFTKLLDALMYYGFTKASTYGISFAMTDFPNKYKPGQTLNDLLTKEPFNPLTIIYNSGARGKESQWKQLWGERGTFGVLDKNQELQNTLTVKNDFYRGVTDLEFFVSCHTTRKGVADIALATADSGALARKLVLALQEVKITKEDCCVDLISDEVPGMKLDILVPALENENDEKYVDRAKSFLKGRYLAEALVRKNKKTVPANTCITDKELKLISSNAIRNLRIRSPLTCKAEKGICAKCYGLSPMTRQAVELETQVGIVAAHSLSEPTTQFTLDSKHGKDHSDKKGAVVSKNPLKVLSSLFRTPQKELKGHLTDALLCYLLRQIWQLYQDKKKELSDRQLPEVLLRILMNFKQLNDAQFNGAADLVGQALAFLVTSQEIPSNVDEGLGSLLQKLEITQEDCCADNDSEALPGYRLTTLLPSLGQEKGEKSTAEETKYIARAKKFLKGRYLADSCIIGEKTYSANSCLTEGDLKNISYKALRELRLRSPLTCKAEKGLCAKCCGLNTSTDLPLKLNKILTSIDDNILSDFMLKVPRKELEKYLTDEIVGYLLQQILQVYKDNKAEVLLQHLHVLLRSMLSFNEQICSDIKGIDKLIKEKPFITQMGYENAAGIIIEAVTEGLVDDFTTINSRIVVGKTLE